MISELPPLTSGEPSPTATSSTYRHNIARALRTEGALRQQAFWLLVATAISALAGVSCVVAWPIYEITALGGAAALFLAFSTALLLLRERKKFSLRFARHYRVINERCIARLDRDWDEFPVRHVDAPDEFVQTSDDLGVFGHASLFQLLCTAETPEGMATLRWWLAQPAPPNVIKARQRAVARLAGELDLRQQFQTNCRIRSQSFGRATEFESWAESPRPYFFGRMALAYVRAETVFVALAIISLFTGLFPSDLVGSILMVVMVANLLLTAAVGGRVHDIMHIATIGNADARLHHAVFRTAASFPDDVPLLASLTSQARAAERQFARLARIAILADARRWWIYYIPLQSLFLWDFHVLELLERWKTTAGKSYRAWHESIAQLEAICSMASLAHDNPDWCFAEFEVADPGSVETFGLGHPLLRDDVRVVNDVAVGPVGTILMVTGSNMSGKSTLLRSLGLNIILAQAGAPVCARRMRLPPIKLATVIRVADSLEQGTSLFMAELERLRHVVKIAADGAIHTADAQVCYILDEILHGTNSAERHLASLRILERLTAAGAIGAVSTHDLSLCSAESIAECCQNVHFRETLSQEGEALRMTFDYRLRPGVAPTTNVGYLLEAVGLGRLDESRE